MNVITISREFGSGGRELGKRLADRLGYDYYDSEIIALVAKESGLDPDYVEHTLTNHSWKDQVITFRGTLASVGYAQSAQVNLLLQQKKVIEDIAALGRDCVIVGRNADVILEACRPFNVFVCASQEAKLRRCLERAKPEEGLTEKNLPRRMREIDGQRARTRQMLTGSLWGQRDGYHLTVNTTGWQIKELVPAVAEFAGRWFGRDV